MNAPVELDRDQAKAAIQAIFPIEDRQTLLPFVLASVRYAHEEDDADGLVIAAFPAGDGPIEYIRIWLGATNVIRTYGPSVLYVVLDSQELKASTLADLRDRHRVEEDGDAYAAQVPSSIGVALDSTDLAAYNDELLGAHRAHIKAASGKRGQFARCHQPVLTSYLRDLADESLG